MNSIRVRFAPSPTGALHIGGIRTALYNYLLAKKLGGTFILRIEDTDQGRYVEGAEKYIVEALKWCGLTPDEGTDFGGNYGPYRQSERKHIYKEKVQILLEKGLAYFAFDTPTELEKMREILTTQGIHDTQYGIKTRSNMRNSITLSQNEVNELIQNNTPFVVRLKVESGQTIQIDDIVRGNVKFQSDELDDKVLMKSDGLPTYHLANIVDDHLMDISHVIRGEEWLPSSAHHILLYKAFGWTPPQFAHLPLILKPDGKGKLSKRDGIKLGIPVFPISWEGATPEESFVGFREYGFEPEAIINFLALLGWSPQDNKELLSINEMISQFSLDKINKSGARFDFEKAKWFNQQYLLGLSDANFNERVKSALLDKTWLRDSNYFDNVVLLYKSRLTFANDFNTQAKYMFHDITEYDEVNIKKRWVKENRTKIEHIIDFVRSNEVENPVVLEEAVKLLINDNGWKLGELFPMLRIGLTGSLQGPGIFELFNTLGIEKAAHRIGKSLDFFDTLI
jgi:glutamyl-tRNA synthetase